MVHQITEMKHKYFCIGTVVLVLFGVGQSSCYYDIESELYGGQLCDTSSIASYSQKVVPIMEQFCTGCHGGNSPQANIALESYDEVSIFVADGRLSCTINHGNDCSAMPENAPKIPECDILEIERWINAGAAND